MILKQGSRVCAVSDASSPYARARSVQFAGFVVAEDEPLRTAISADAERPPNRAARSVACASQDSYDVAEKRELL